MSITFNKQIPRDCHQHVFNSEQTDRQTDTKQHVTCIIPRTTKTNVFGAEHHFRAGVPSVVKSSSYYFNCASGHNGAPGCLYQQLKTRSRPDIQRASRTAGCQVISRVLVCDNQTAGGLGSCKTWPSFISRWHPTLPNHNWALSISGNKNTRANLKIIQANTFWNTHTYEKMVSSDWE